MEITVVTLVEEQISPWKGHLPRTPLSYMMNFEVCLNGVGVSAMYRVQELGDQVKLERWQGMVRARAARSNKDGLLGVQGEEVAFFLVPKVMTRLGVTRM
ncbi:hypothetical protein Tco_1226633 [Tanacetum coccineum]